MTFSSSFFFQLIECPSIYELMPCTDYNWQHPPVMEVWREEKGSNDGQSNVSLHTYCLSQSVEVFKEALSCNTVSYDCFLWNIHLIYHSSKAFFSILWTLNCLKSSGSLAPVLIVALLWGEQAKFSGKDSMLIALGYYDFIFYVL